MLSVCAVSLGLHMLRARKQFWKEIGARPSGVAVSSVFIAWLLISTAVATKQDKFGSCVADSRSATLRGRDYASGQCQFQQIAGMTCLDGCETNGLSCRRPCAEMQFEGEHFKTRLRECLENLGEQMQCAVSVAHIHSIYVSIYIYICIYIYL